MSAVDAATTEFFDRFFAAKNGRDIDYLISCFTDDLIYDDRTIWSRVIGKEELRKGWEYFLGSNDAQFELDEITGSIDAGVALIMLDQPPSVHPEKTIPIMALIEFRDHKISRWVDVWDGSLLTPEQLNEYRRAVLDGQGRPGPQGETHDDLD